MNSFRPEGPSLGAMPRASPECSKIITALHIFFVGQYHKEWEVNRGVIGRATI
jgi:hypothetical protein